MKKKILNLLLIVMFTFILAGCGKKENKETKKEEAFTYVGLFQDSSKAFKINIKSYQNNEIVFDLNINDNSFNDNKYTISDDFALFEINGDTSIKGAIVLTKPSILLSIRESNNEDIPVGNVELTK